MTYRSRSRGRPLRLVASRRLRTFRDAGDERGRGGPTSAMAHRGSPSASRSATRWNASRAVKARARTSRRAALAARGARPPDRADRRSSTAAATTRRRGALRDRSSTPGRPTEPLVRGPALERRASASSCRARAADRCGDPTGGRTGLCLRTGRPAVNASAARTVQAPQSLNVLGGAASTGDRRSIHSSTRRSPIRLGIFTQAADFLRGHGVRLAIDDAGSALLAVCAGCST